MDEKKREYHKLWVQRNRKKILAYYRAYYLAHREKQLLENKRYYLSHREVIKSRSKKYYLENKERCKLYWKCRYQNDREKFKAYQREYRRTHLKQSLLRERLYHQLHHEEYKRKNSLWKKSNRSKVNIYNQRRRVRKKQCVGNFTYSEWKSLVERYGYKCLGCKKIFPIENLSIDHVVPLSKNGSGSIENIQPLCVSCNASKQDKIVDYRSCIPRK